MNHYSYHSEQVHSAFANGKGQTRRNSVDIKNGQGYKSVETYTADGKLKARNEKQLNQTELDCIKRNKFIPGLFNDCIKPLKLTNKSNKPTKTRKRTK
jgi:hypothetical protein